MIYKWNDLGISLEIEGSRGKLYLNDSLKFIGDSYLSIKKAIALSGDHPSVIDKFKNQLEQREKCRFNDNSQRFQDKHGE
jgi:hypothetical protein